MTASPFLTSALEFLVMEVKPKAQAIDQDPEVLRVAMNELYRRGLMAAKVPITLGGAGLSDPEFRIFQEELARHSGTLAFLSTQHQSAASMIARGDNEELAQSVVPQMGRGGERIGIGFSQLRRPGPPMLRAAGVEGGYRIDGTVPWATGFSFYERVLIGAALDDGQSLFALAPFGNAPGVKSGAVMRLAAMESAQTVELYYDELMVPDKHVVMIRPPKFIERNDMINVTLQGHFAIGCALAAVDVIAEAYSRRKHPFLLSAQEALGAEIDQCRAAMVQASDGGEELTSPDRLSLRAWVIELMVRCAHAAIVASAGAANALSHPAQRIYREAIVFSVSAQTTEIMESTIARLVRTAETPSVS